MSEFSFKTDIKSEAYCLKIAQRMIELFNIVEAEAIGRINEQLKHIAEWVGEDNIYYHETVDDWARNIYYGEDYENKACWWIKGSNPRPKLFP